ncbi:MAG: hypothetical protein ACYTHM_00620 [Planctomycetota bacterium]|jgi:hypothetical protein
MVKYCLIIPAVILGFLGSVHAQVEIELLDGTRISASFEGWQGGKLVIRPLANGGPLTIPPKYLSPFSRYQAERLQAPEREQAPEQHLASVKWCLRYLPFDGRLKGAAEEEIRKALAKGVDREALDGITLAFDLWWSEKGALTDPGDGGYVKDPDSGVWEKEAERERRKREKENRIKAALLIGNPGDYKRIPLAVVSGSRALFQGKAIRFWSHLRWRHADFPAVRTLAGYTLTPAKHVRLILTDEDCATVFIPRTNKKLLQKLDLLEKGERIQVFGKIHLTPSAFLVVVVDLVSG